MNSVTASPPAESVSIPEHHREAASRYIAAIASEDPFAFLGPAYQAERASELWNRFVGIYESIVTGPYAKHGPDAIRVALGRL